MSKKALSVSAVVISSPERSNSESAVISFKIEKSEAVRAVPSVLLIILSFVISFLVIPIFSISCKASSKDFDALNVTVSIWANTEFTVQKMYAIIAYLFNGIISFFIVFDFFINLILRK